MGGINGDQYILKTTDGGTTWINQKSGTSTYLSSVYFADYNTGWIVSSYIIKTTNGGANWIEQTSGTPHYKYSVFFIDNNIGWTVGDGGTILKTTNGGVSVGIQNVSSEIPDKFSLLQNFPNPFNPTTNIKFDIPKKSFVKLVIYNLLGKEITTFVNEELNSGSYQADWNASEYPSGIYFFRIEAEDFVLTKSMVLLK